MEHIGKVLQDLGNETHTPDLKITEPKELTLEEHREELRQALCVASLDNTFDNFKPVKGTERALAMFRALSSGETDKPLLLCYGGVGNGKTHLCEAAAIALYQRGLFCRVGTMDTMMSSLKSCMEPEHFITYEKLSRNFCYSKRLIIDDVEGTDWAMGELEKIVRVRYREELLTIMTTNRDISELPETIVSRFSDPNVGVVVLNEGADYRRLKHG